jgi:hypothetical protein
LGYLLDNIFLQEIITIPESTVSTMGTSGFKIIDNASNEIKIIYAFSIQTLNSTIDYTLFTNIFISNKASGPGGAVFGYSDNDLNSLSSAYILDLSINSFDYINSRRGSVYKYGTDLFLRFTNNPTAGNGDLKCTMIYKQFTSV